MQVLQGPDSDRSGSKSVMKKKKGKKPAKGFLAEHYPIMCFGLMGSCAEEPQRAQ